METINEVVRLEIRAGCAGTFNEFLRFRMVAEADPGLFNHEASPNLTQTPIIRLMDGE